MALDNLIKLIDNLERFDSRAELHTIVENNTEVIADLQKEQMGEGRDRNGNETILKDNAPWNFGYRPFTKRVKEAFGSGLGAVTDRVTGFMTGALYDSLKTNLAGDVFVQKSDVGYFDELTARTGPDWMGLDIDKRKDFAKLVTVPEFAKVLLEKTGLDL